jgi:hypothetical protein
VGKLIIGTGPIDRFPPAFIATRYQLGLTFSESLMARVRTYNPSFFVLGYMSANLHPRDLIYAENNLHEERFMHSGDPAFSHAATFPARVDLWWVPDRRPELAGTGSAVYRQLSGEPAAARVATLSAGVTSYSDSSVPAGATATYTIRTRSGTGVEYEYSDPLTVTATDGGPGWGPLVVATSTASDSVTLTVTVDADPGVTAPVLFFDRDENRALAVTERYPLSVVGPAPGGRTTYTITIRGGKNASDSGYSYLLVDESGSNAPSLPLAGNATTNINNRVRSQYYGYYGMNLSDAAWTAAIVDSVNKKMALGYNGVFMDEMVQGLWWLGLDSNVLGVTEDGYKDQCLSLMSRVRADISPKPLIYNGSPDNELYTQSDAAMMEGFAVAPWHTGGYLPEGAWIGQVDLALRAVQLSRKGVLTLLRCDPNDVPKRMYGFASFLLSKGEYQYMNCGFEDTTTVYVPEWDLKLGVPMETYPKASLYRHGSGLYGRRFEKALVLVNPSETETYAETMPQAMYRVDPIGGLVPELGGNGDIIYTPVTSVSLAPRTAAILVTSPTGQP